jgi:phytoene dehydrogenase-like protein
MSSPRVVVLGGGLAGAAAAYALARAGWPEITVVERSGYLGGLAGTFERNGNFYPTGVPTTWLDLSISCASPWAPWTNCASCA